MSRLAMNNKNIVKKMVCVAMIFVLSVALFFMLKLNEKNENTGYDVVYVIDNSGSISKDSAYAKARTLALSNVTNLAQDSNMRVGVVFFGDMIEHGDVLPLAKMDQERVQVVNAFLEKDHSARNDHTDIGEGLKCAQTLFKNSSRQKVILLFTDGIDDNDYSDPSKETRKQVSNLEKKEIPIYCVYYSESKNNLGALENIVNYYGDYDYASTRLISTDEMLKAIDMKVFLDYANEKNVMTKMSKKEMVLTVLLIMVVIFLLVLAVFRKSKGHINGDAILELKGLMGELETIQLLCTQEVLKIRKVKQTMGWNSAIQSYDFAKFDAIIGEIQSADSLKCEAKMRIETGEKNRYTMTNETYKDLSSKVRQSIKVLQKNLDFLRKENMTISGLVSKYY